MHGMLPLFAEDADLHNPGHECPELVLRTLDFTPAGPKTRTWNAHLQGFLATVRRMPRLTGLTLALAGFVACGGSAPEPTAIRLVDRFDAATVVGTVSAEVPEPTEWRFDGAGSIPTPEDDTEGAETFGWTAFSDIEGLAVSEGLLVGTTGDLPVLRGLRPDRLDQDDVLHAVEIRMRVSEGAQIGVTFNNAETLNRERVLRGIGDAVEPPLYAALIPGDDIQTYTLENIARSFPIATIRNILVRPTDAAGAEFAIESIRLIPRREHLLSLDSGPGWHGLSEIYRETIISRSPERITIDIDAQTHPWLDLAVGTIEDGPITFVVGLSVGSATDTVWRRTVTTPHRWETARIDLASVANQPVTLSLSLEATRDDMIGFWGNPVVRNGGALPSPVEISESRAALADGGATSPQGVILILADTLRRDHLQTWHYERPTTPVLAELAAEGAMFADNISQATWTKVSVPAILSSLYPTSHGIVGMPDRLPASATTLAEAFLNAGFATFHTSSVQFTGKLTNLHQGVEVLHERASIDGDALGVSNSKTARTYIDRFLEWVAVHHDVPFFAFIHVFDPHTPFEPYAPYDTMWAPPTGKADHEARLKQVQDHFGENARVGVRAHRGPESLPDTVELEQAGVDVDAFLDHEIDWYDGSIRAMDVEIGRLLEGLDQLGLSDKTLVAFISDHGEELLDHGKHFHGNSLYGEMLNVPLILWWPGVVPPGLVVEETTESISLMPTLLELSGLPRPDALQGQSLVPFMASPGSPSTFGWEPRPAFSERVSLPSKAERELDDLDGFSIVTDGWKLIQNLNPPEGFPEYELFDHDNDPLNHENVATEHPDVVERLAGQLAERQRWAEARRLPSDEDALEGLSPAELNRLRSLGYIR